MTRIKIVENDTIRLEGKIDHLRKSVQEVLNEGSFYLNLKLLYTKAEEKFRAVVIILVCAVLRGNVDRATITQTGSLLKLDDITDALRNDPAFFESVLYFFQSLDEEQLNLIEHRLKKLFENEISFERYKFVHQSGISAFLEASYNGRDITPELDSLESRDLASHKRLKRKA